MTKISRRAESLGTENAFVVLAEVNALARQGKDIISFCIGQPDFPAPEHVQQAAIKAIKGGKHGYTPSAGIDELRQAAADYLGRTERHQPVRRVAVDRHDGLAGGQIHHDTEAAAGDDEPVASRVVRDADRVQPVVAEVRRTGTKREQVAIPSQ